MTAQECYEQRMAAVAGAVLAHESRIEAYEAKTGQEFRFVLPFPGESADERDAAIREFNPGW